MDGFGRPTQTTNAKNQVTLLGWDADNNVTRLEENNHAVSTWTYDPLTGYPLTQKDAEANKNGTAGTCGCPLFGRPMRPGRIHGLRREVARSE
jgi:YD repeat-containing protein